MQRILIADTETTGFSTTKDGICEISFLEVDEELTEVLRFEKLINPGVPISPSASAVNGITDEDVKNCPSMEEALKGFGSDYFDDVFLLAHNSPFDRRFLKKFWTINGDFCTLKAARYLYPQAENHKLGTLRYWLKLDTDTEDRKDALAHSALGDVLVTLALLKRMIKDSGKTLPQLHDLICKPKKITTMSFGKFKGMKLRALPKNYVKWLLTLEKLDDDLRTALLKL